MFRELGQRSRPDVATPEIVYPIEDIRGEIVRHGGVLLRSAGATEALRILFAEDGYTPELLQQAEWFLWPSAGVLTAHLSQVFPNARVQIGSLRLHHFGDRETPLAAPARDHNGVITGFFKRTAAGHPAVWFDVQPPVSAPDDDAQDLPAETMSTPEATSEEAPFGDDLFNLYRCKDHPLLVLVTDLADAIYLSALGFEGVAALGGRDLTPEQVQKIHKLGIRQVCLALHQVGADGLDQTRHAVKTLENRDIRIYVLDPRWLQAQGGPAGLVRREGTTALTEAIDKAQRALAWQFQDILKRFDLSTDRGLDQALDEFIALYESLDDPVARRSVQQTLQTALGFNEAEVKSALRARHKRSINQKAQEALKETIARLKSAAAAGNITVAELELVRGVHDLRQFHAIDLPTPYCELAEELQCVPDTLSTGYDSLDRLMRIPADAVTVVAAPPRQGKSIFMLNLLYKLLRRNSGKAFFYFGYTETRRQMALKLVMRIAGEVLDPRFNMAAYAQYLKDAPSENPAIDHAHALYLNYARTGRLLISDRHYTVGRLCQVMRFFATTRDIGAVMIDSIEHLPPEPAATATLPGTPREACHQLVEMAQQQHIPVIIGASLATSANLRRGGVFLEDLQPPSLVSLADLIIGVYTPDQHELIRNEATSTTLERNLNEDISSMDVHVLSQRRGNSGGQVSLSLNVPVFSLQENMHQA